MIAARSPEAAILDGHARRYVDEVNRRHYAGRISQETARDVYRAACGSEAQRLAREELEPINRHLVRFASISLAPMDVPPAIEEMRHSIINRWQAAYLEAIG